MKLDKYEKNILESVEKEEWVSKKNIDNRLLELQSYIKSQNKQKIMSLTRKLYKMALLIKT